MKKLSTIKRGETNTYFTNKERTIKFPLNLSYLNYGTRVNLKDKVYYSYDEKCNYPTINELLASGELVEKKYVPTHTILITNKKVDFRTIQSEFRNNGIVVSISGIKYVYNAWKNGNKVGYRGKGFFLFAPCGRYNPLSITATKTDPHFRNWQKTYIC